MSISNPSDYVEAALNDPNVKMVCVNDTPCDTEFESIMTRIIAIFDRKLPSKSAFEK